MTTQYGTIYFTFKVSLRTDDAEILYHIQRYFGVGHVRVGHRNGGANPLAVFVVNRLEDLVAVVLPHFERCPLRSKKARDLAIFGAAVRYAWIMRQRRQGAYPEAYWTTLFAYRTALQQVKRFAAVAA